MERADVTDLYPWLEYQFRIIATNDHGSGEASIPSLKIKTWDAGNIKTFPLFHAKIRLENDLVTSGSSQLLWFPPMMWLVMEAETAKL